MQLKLETFTEENRRLKIQLGTALNAPPKKKSVANDKKSKEPMHVKDSELESEPEILSEQEDLMDSDGMNLDNNTRKRTVAFGSKFSVMNELFIQRSVFLVAKPSRASSMAPTRYSSVASKKAGVVAELYEEIPNDCHILLETNLAFQKKVWFH